MNRATFSLEIFGDRLPLVDYYSSGDNNKRIEQMKQALSEAIKTELTDRQRMMVTEFYYGGQSVTEIARNHGLSKSTVSRHLTRSRERLKSALRYGMYTFWSN